MKSQQIIDEGTHGDAAFIMRFRQRLCEAQDFMGYPKVLRIIWTYSCDDRSGMPSHKQSEEMGEFEDHLVEALERDYHAVLSAVITERCTREWILYTADLPECARRITEMPQKPERYPIELVADDDPTWSYFRETIRTIRGREAQFGSA